MPVALEPRRLGPYELITLIGSGGMGQVYRARDTRLNRDVAVKIVAGAVDQEARAASSLNHPNILTIHDVGVEEGVSFIVSELVDGRSLREVLAAGPLPMRKVLDYGIGIASGLAAAHEAGIVHRDLKPENVMITRDDRVKILDFGIAKRDETSADAALTLGRSDTQAGMLLGTTAYMSPEQARGGRVNFYSDQFSLGLLLYEMATGEPAFRRDSPLQTLSAILTDDPPELNAGSVPFRWLVKRCLHKEPDHRYASTTDLVRELENIRQHISAEAPALIFEDDELPVQTGRQSRRPAWVAMAAMVVAAAALGFAADRIFSGPGTSSPPEFLPLVSTPELEVSPAWAPNGRTVAYSAAVDGVFQIFTRSLGGAGSTQLTYSADDCLHPFWAPDGSRVYFTAARKLWAVGATGGSPEALLENVGRAAIAPDGRTFAVLRGERLFSLWVGPLNAMKQIDGGPFLAASYLHFSPDGKRLGAWMSTVDGQTGLRLYPAQGGTPDQPLGTRADPAREFTWLKDSRTVVFSEGSAFPHASHLWKADVDHASVTALTFGTGLELSPAASPDGKTVAFASAVLDYDVVHVGWNGELRDLLASTRYEASPSVSKSADWAFVTDVNGPPELWLQGPEGGWSRPLIAANSFEDATTALNGVTFAPDGRRLAYSRRGTNEEAIWISTISGDPPVRLAREPQGAIQREPAWSPDGNSIAYWSVRDGGKLVLRLARPGGAEPAETIAEDAGTSPQWSPKGDAIALIAPGGGLTLLKPDGSNRRSVGTGLWLRHGWSADGAEIIGIKRSSERRLSLAAIRASDGSERLLADLGPYPAAFTYATSLGLSPLCGFSLEPDGSGFVTSILRVSSDLWTMRRAQR